LLFAVDAALILSFFRLLLWQKRNKNALPSLVLLANQRVARFASISVLAGLLLTYSRVSRGVECQPSSIRCWAHGAFAVHLLAETAASYSRE